MASHLGPSRFFSNYRVSTSTSPSWGPFRPTLPLSLRPHFLPTHVLDLRGNTQEPRGTRHRDPILFPKHHPDEFSELQYLAPLSKHPHGPRRRLPLLRSSNHIRQYGQGILSLSLRKEPQQPISTHILNRLRTLSSFLFFTTNTHHRPSTSDSQLSTLTPSDFLQKPKHQLTHPGPPRIDHDSANQAGGNRPHPFSSRVPSLPASVSPHVHSLLMCLLFSSAFSFQVPSLFNSLLFSGPLSSHVPCLLECLLF